MTRKHVVITGTGRAGTSFLVELLTHLGLETGYQLEDLAKHKCQTARAGLEHDIRRSDAPYIVKSPWFCDYAAEVLARDDISIEHVLIPMRDLRAAAESRRFVTNAALSTMTVLKRLRSQIFSNAIAGGVWHTSRPIQQEAVLLEQIYKLLLSLSNTAIPVTLLRYPLLANDAGYLFRKLQPILGNIQQPEFEAAFQRIADPNLIHQFSNGDR
ncbi:MAG TPA: hypothetical protein VGM98_12395 [Schlesneria sp.]|jgi:hypothetical protein